MQSFLKNKLKKDVAKIAPQPCDMAWRRFFMLKPFSKYLRTQGKAANTAAAYCRDVSLYLKWCQAAFGEQPARLYRANVLEYISFMRNVKGYDPRTVNRHLSSLRCLNDWLVKTGQQAEAAVLPNDFMKIPEAERKRAWALFLWYKYADFDLDKPFLKQYRQNMTKLLAGLSQIASKASPCHLD